MRIYSTACTKYNRAEVIKMLNNRNILETINMIEKENLDIRTITITMGISLSTAATATERSQGRRSTTRLQDWLRISSKLESRSRLNTGFP